jgi:hypothetical protein
MYSNDPATCMEYGVPVHEISILVPDTGPVYFHFLIPNIENISPEEKSCIF